jgi:hypothetical protein
MTAPVRKTRLHRALGRESVVAGNSTFWGSIDAFVVFRVARTVAEVQASMGDTRCVVCVDACWVCPRVCVFRAHIPWEGVCAV